MLLPLAVTHLSVCGPAYGMPGKTTRQGCGTARRERHGGHHVRRYGLGRPEAARELEKDGLSLEVVDLRTLLPYDEEAVLASVRKCNKVILLHEDTRTGGMAGELAALIAEKAFEDLDGPIMRITAPDTPVPFSPPLEEYFLPNARKVVEAARKLAEF